MRLGLITFLMSCMRFPKVFEKLDLHPKDLRLREGWSAFHEGPREALWETEIHRGHLYEHRSTTP